MLAQTLRFLEAREAGAAGLAALEPHLRRQPQHCTSCCATAARCTSTTAGRCRAPIDKTIAHLREVQPTVYFNVPRGYEMMLPALEQADEAELARASSASCAWCSMPAPACRCRHLAPAGSRGRPRAHRTAVDDHLMGQHRDRAGQHLRAAGTSTGPASSACRMPGVPPEVRAQRRQAGDARARATTSSPATAATRPSHARSLRRRRLLPDRRRRPPERRAADPLQGVVFNGRVAEDFKLTSGTWVSVGTLRVKVVSAMAPYGAGRRHHRPRPQRSRRAAVPVRIRPAGAAPSRDVSDDVCAQALRALQEELKAVARRRRPRARCCCPMRRACRRRRDHRQGLCQPAPGADSAAPPRSKRLYANPADPDVIRP